MRENKRKNRDFEREKEELLEGRREQKGERESKRHKKGRESQNKRDMEIKAERG